MPKTSAAKSQTGIWHDGLFRQCGQTKAGSVFRDVGHLIGRSVVVVWFSIPFLCASLHIGGPHWAVLCARADSRHRRAYIAIISCVSSSDASCAEGKGLKSNRCLLFCKYGLRPHMSCISRWLWQRCHVDELCNTFLESLHDVSGPTSNGRSRNPLIHPFYDKLFALRTWALVSTFTRFLAFSLPHTQSVLVPYSHAFKLTVARFLSVIVSLPIRVLTRHYSHSLAV